MGAPLSGSRRPGLAGRAHMESTIEALENYTFSGRR
jgi:hypothetical protein